ncbi:MAG: [Fe-Fe] hydrogenase large subunit C-terminal domain-containing protein [Dehalobacterium sp.]
MDPHEIYHRILVNLARQIREGGIKSKEKLVSGIVSECLPDKKSNQRILNHVEKQLDYLLKENNDDPPLIDFIDDMCQECSTADQHPCTDSCPTGAISCTEGIHHINRDLCIECGRCINTCISGAIVARSEFAQVATMLRDSSKQPVYAILAPSFVGQFGREVTPDIFKSALRAMGFTEVYEVALAADITTLYEGEEFCQRMERGEKFMITSCCCPAFIKFIEKIRPKVANLVSPTISPMIAMGKMLKQREANCRVVFIGPCIAKKNEAKRPDLQPAVDCVLTFKETKALLEAADIKLDGSLGRMEINDASHDGRIYAHTGGVTEAVMRAVKARNSNIKVIPVKGNGLKQCGELLEKIEKGSVRANFMEGMGCPGGCIGGPGTIIKVEESVPYVKKFADRSDFFTCNDNPTAHEWMEDYYKITDTLSKKMSMVHTNSDQKNGARPKEYLS